MTGTTTKILPANTAAAETSKTDYMYGTKQPYVGCLACVPKSASACDTTCQASELTTRHALWGCLDARLCASLAPITANATAWKPWKLYVLDTVPSTDTQGEAYAVRETPLHDSETKSALPKSTGVPSGTVPCVDYARVWANKLNVRMLGDMAPADAAGGALKRAAVLLTGGDLLRRQVYVCAAKNDLRAYSCLAAIGAVTNTVVFKCVKDDGTAANGFKPLSTDAVKAAAWAPVVGAMGEIVPTFAERFPTCLQATSTAHATAKTALAKIESWDAFETLILSRPSGVATSVKWN